MKMRITSAAALVALFAACGEDRKGRPDVTRTDADAGVVEDGGSEAGAVLETGAAADTAATDAAGAGQRCPSRPPPAAVTAAAKLGAQATTPGTPPAPPGPPAGDPKALPPAVLADRLSRALWGTPADAALIGWVAECPPTTVKELEDVARYMVMDARMKAGVATFASWWLELDGVRNVRKQDPTLTPQLRAALAEETKRFVTETVLDEKSSLVALFTRPSTFVDADLAGLYDVTPPAAPGLSPVTLDPNVRAGVFTQGSLLALTSDEDRNRPSRRGAFYVRKFLCEDVPPDPEPMRPAPPANTNARAWLTEQTTGSMCQPCHTTVDSFGFALDAFDPIGRALPRPGGQPVDTRATITLPQPTTVDGAPALARALAGTREAERCFVRHWLEHATGKKVALKDDSVEYVWRALRNHGGDLREAIVATTSSQAFLAP